MEMHSATSSTLPRVVRFRFVLEAVDPLHLPAYPGSTWRGRLGHGLRRSVCVTRQPTCDGCLLCSTCVYSTVFESPAIAGAEDGRYRALPHPFVLDIPTDGNQDIAPGQTATLGINLIGPALQHMPYLIHALQVAGQEDPRRSGGRFEIVTLEREPCLGSGDWHRVYERGQRQYQAQIPQPMDPPAPPQSAVKLTFATPLRIKRNGHLVGAAELDAQDLLRNLCARLALLAKHYGGDPTTFDWRHLRDHAQAVTIRESEMRWHDWTRYSSRQQTAMQLGGLLGSLRLDGPGLATFWHGLWYGQWVHLGKGTSFGLGHYRLEPMAS